MNTTVNVSAREFIEDYLIKQINTIKQDNPYFAFLLMAVGIEFLGRCQSTNDWNNTQNSKTYFDDGL